MPWTLFATVAVFLVVMGAMAIGVLISGRRIRGSCGGLANLRDKDGKTMCDACTNPSPECRGEPPSEEAKS